MLILRTVFFILLCITASSHAKENTILVLGDSLSAAYGIDIQQGWVNLLQNRLNNNYNGETTWNVINASVSGETTAGALARLSDLLKTHQPSVCILGLGANNGLRGQSLHIMKDQLNSIVQQCKQHGLVLLLGIKIPPNYGDKYTNEFHLIYKQIAEKNNISYVPFMLDGIVLNNKYMQKDGLHPNAQAQPIILDNIWPSLFELLTVNNNAFTQ